ncbi:hypothetical protein ACIQUQ_23230 [Streptomyces sp. NPDC101118]|uniref:hypothetical protein n=1 Tax=Streptomyces sp. NPDC101118 TaxID=3366109 RepID=UPI0037F653A9
MAEHCVLLLSRRGDREAGEVTALLRRIGVPVHRLDADGLAGVGAVVGPDGELTLGGRRLAPTVTWLRHFSLRSAPAGGPGSAGGVPGGRSGAGPGGAKGGGPGGMGGGPGGGPGGAQGAGPGGAPVPGPGGGAAAGRMAYRDAWTALARQIALASPAAIGATDPGQLTQRARARALGLRTPRSLVTTDPSAAAALLPAPRYVLKVLDRHVVEPEPGRLAWYLPRVLDRGSLAAGLPGLPPGTPLVLQEYVAHDTELRVYLAGQELHAFEVAKDDPRDIWDRPDAVGVRHVPAPPAVAAAARALADSWGLVYGAFDFLSDRGEPVFLEVNAHGDWHWFERKAGVDAVTRAAVRAVRDLHRNALGRARPRPVDLLSFLGAGAPAGPPPA